MPAPKENPHYIYKILDSAPSTPLPTTFPSLSELDQKDGFIHLSTARQVSSYLYLSFHPHPPTLSSSIVYFVGASEGKGRGRGVV